MRKSLILLTFLFAAQFSIAQKQITLEDLWLNYEYYPSGIGEFRSMKDGLFYTMAEGVRGQTQVVKYNYETGAKAGVLVDLNPRNNTLISSFDSYEFSPDERFVLLSNNSESIYRHSFKADYFIYDTQSHTVTKVFDKKIIYPSFSPTENKLAFIYENNLYMLDVSANKLTQITQDGEINKVLNGLPDWVYEEEFTFHKAYEWSPNGSAIAWLRFDESEVPSFTMPVFGNGIYPQNYVFKYPKVGEKNSIVTLHSFNLKNQQTQKLNIGVEYEYIPRFSWINDTELAVFTMPRLQNELKIMAVRLDGSSKEIYSEKADTYIEITDDFEFLADKFIIRSEMDGFYHLYAYNYEGKMLNQITKGNYDVMSLDGIDESGNFVYYTAALPDPMNRTIYKKAINGSTPEITISKELGYHSADFSANCKYFIDKYSTLTTAPVYTIYDGNGQKIRVLEDNMAFMSKLSTLEISTPEFFKVPVEGNIELNAWMIKPTNFNPKKKYPVFMTVYGGPGSQEVLNQWNGFDYFWHQMLAQQGYMVVCVDNRGTGARGRDFRTITYKRLGFIETNDQISAAKYLGNLPCVDKSRIGIFGWSYGGYMSSLCITRGADVFKTAIAVAPVTNWKFYDNIYTERYMGTLEVNPKGYDENAPMNFVKMLKGNYLLIHGTADDNVHYQNAAVLSAALVNANKDFEQFIYTDKNHGIYGGVTRYHLFKKMTDFIKRKL